MFINMLTIKWCIIKALILNISNDICPYMYGATEIRHYDVKIFKLKKKIDFK